ncbi:unnamed protein product [Penicillium glandicola]
MSNRHSKGSTAPKDSKEWQTEVLNRALAGSSIHSALLASAPNFDFKQFLMLRVLWKEHPTGAILRVANLNHWVAQATAKLDQYRSWSTYCDSFRSQEALPEGTFAIARYYQREVAHTEPKADPQAFHTPISSRTRGATNWIGEGVAAIRLEDPKTPTKKGPKPLPSTSATSRLENMFGLDDESSPSPSPSPVHLVSPITRELGNILYPPTKDEQIVNTALIVFLNALTIHFPLSSKWTLHRNPFTATFKDAQFEARTDGYLDSPGGKPRVLIEVKPVLRSLNLLAIQMQESSQMVAWIKSDDEFAQKANTTRFHISQDRHYIYVTVATYDHIYLEYLLDGKTSQNQHFLTMDQYGPWDTTNEGQMRQLGPILLAITLRAERESQEEQKRAAKLRSA